MSPAAILALNILRYYYPIPDLKAFHRLAKEPYQGLFPGLPYYENVLKGTSKAMPCMLLVLPYFLLINREMGGDGLFFMDSRPVCVRDNQDSYRHTVSAGFASRGKTSKGWFLGFNRHGVCDAQGNRITARFTTGNAHDRTETAPLTEGREGMQATC